MEEKLKRLTEMFPHIIKSYHSVSASLTKNMDVTLNQFKAILYIDAVERSTLNELSSALNIAGSTTSEMVDRMVRRKYLNRAPDKENRRQVVITIGPKGEKTIADFHQMAKEHFEKIFKILSPKNRDKFYKAYEMLYEVTKEIDKSVEQR